MKTLLSIALGLLLMNGAAALYAPADLKKVPIKKLIATLQKQAEKEPGNAETHHHLARAHAMAFSQKLAETGKVDTDAKSKQLWFGFEPAFVPFTKTKKAADEAARKRGLEHLTHAIGHYESALKLKPADAKIRLGYGWCLGQAGKKKEAIAAYRAAINEFWKSDGKLDGTFGPIGTVEAAGYLIPLLDAKKDQKEIADLNKKVAKIESLPRAITPIAVALNSNASLEDIVAPDAAVTFDADGTGRQDAWSWITPKAAWLVYDRTGQGQIDSAIQMFGSRTFMLFFEDGYAALRLLDEDGDGSLSGGELECLALWHDGNGNGISEPGEVEPMENYGIESILACPTTHSSGIPYCRNGVRYTDGTETATFDVLLDRKGSRP
jgi:tetratricopeptide (TPR) repeat protein